MYRKRKLQLCPAVTVWTMHWGNSNHLSQQSFPILELRKKKKIQQIIASACLKVLWGCGYLFNNFGRTSKSTSSLESCWYIQAVEASSGREPGSQQEPGSAQQQPRHPPATLHTRAGVSSTDTSPHWGQDWTLPIWQAGHNGMLRGFVWFSKH